MSDDPLASFRPAADERLATGWDADTPSGDTVVHDYLTTLVARLRRTAERTGGRYEETASATFVDCGSAYLFDNVAVCAGPLGQRALDVVAERATEFFRTSPGWSVLCFDHRADMRAHGLELIGHPPLMFRPAGGEGPAVPSGVAIRPVVDERTLADFEATLVEAYPLPPGSAVADPRLLGDGLRAWVGYLDGAAVATAGSFTAGRMTEIEWVSTRAVARGTGIGAAMTWTALSADPQAAAALVATDPGRPVYERLGFTALLRLSMWMHA